MEIQRFEHLKSQSETVVNNDFLYRGRISSAGSASNFSPLSVISAKVKLALLWRSTLSEKTSVLSARKGSPEKKSVSPRYSYQSCHLLQSDQNVIRSPSTEASPLLPPSHYRRELVRISHRGICL